MYPLVLVAIVMSSPAMVRSPPTTVFPVEHNIVLHTIGLQKEPPLEMVNPVKVPTEVILVWAAVCNVPVRQVELRDVTPVIVVDNATSSAFTVMLSPAMTLRVFPVLVMPAPAVI